MRLDKVVVTEPLNAMGFLVDHEADLDKVCFTCATEVSMLHDCGDCSGCCQCQVCYGCFKILELAACSACHRCNECCQCYACVRCQCAHANINDLCQYCGMGTGNTCGCCRHTQRREGNYRRSHDVNLLRYVAPEAGDRRINSSPRLLSAEMEICGIDYAHLGIIESTLSSWHVGVVGDGTLPAGGFEINTHPAGGDFWHDQITDICKSLSVAKAWVSYVAGCHIHVDCRDFGYTDLAKALRLLACVEAGLYALVPRYRASSENFCAFWAPNYLPCIRNAEEKLGNETNERKVALQYRRHILAKFYGYTKKDEIARVSRSKGNGNRYRGVNLHSFTHRGTIEFRMPQGMVYPDNIINWGMLLANLMDIAKHRTMEEIKPIVANVERTLMNDSLIGRRWSDLPDTFVKASFRLLSELAPNSIVRDWMVERRKWAETQRNADSYRESYGGA